MLALDRFIPLPGARRRALARASNWPARHRRRSPTRRIARVRTLLPALCGIGVAAVAGWLLAGGSLPSARTLVGQLEPAAVETSADGAPVHLDSTPSGASVRIDGTSRGKTPLDTWLSPGQHSLTLQHPDALDDDQPLQVADSGEPGHRVVATPAGCAAATTGVSGRHAGRRALSGRRPGRTARGYSRAIWSNGDEPRSCGGWTPPRHSHSSKPARERAHVDVVLAPDEEQVAYVTPGSASNLSASLWPVNGNTPARPQDETHAEAVWLAPLDGSQPPRRIFELPFASGPGAANNPERIVDLVWTPDGSD